MNVDFQAILTSPNTWIGLGIGIVATWLANPIGRLLRVIFRVPLQFMAREGKAAWAHVGVFNFAKDSPSAVSAYCAFNVAMLNVSAILFFVALIFARDAVLYGPTWQPATRTIVLVASAVIGVGGAYGVFKRWLALFWAYETLVDIPYSQKPTKPVTPESNPPLPPPQNPPSDPRAS